MEYIYEFSNLLLFQDESNINNYKIRTMRNETRINFLRYFIIIFPILQLYKSNKRTNINYIKFQTFFSERPKSKNSTLSSENTN